MHSHSKGGSGTRIAAGVCILLAASVAGGCAPQKPAPPFKPTATLGEVMHNIVIPNAEVVWDAAGTIITIKGVEEIQPQNADEWFDVESSATTLMEAGNLLMMDGRAKDNTKWMERCRALIDAGESVRQAAKAKDVAALFTRGGGLFEACQGCHFEYRFQKDPSTIRTH
jgi:cytochrome c556